MMSVFNCLNICYAYQNTFPRLTRVRVTRYISSKFNHDIKVDDYDSDWDMGLLANYTLEAAKLSTGCSALARGSSLLEPLLEPPIKLAQIVLQPRRTAVIYTVRCGIGRARHLYALCGLGCCEDERERSHGV